MTVRLLLLPGSLEPVTSESLPKATKKQNKEEKK